jgi:flagellin-specific chaperone FliS
MSKKKSYMDNDNILSENFLKKLRNKIADKLVVRGMKKDKKILKRVDDLNKELKDFWDDLNKQIQEFKPEHKPWKPKKVTIDDFIG